MCQIAFHLLEAEVKEIEKVTRIPNEKGFGEGIVGPGFVMH